MTNTTIITGHLKSAYARIKPDTMLHVDQLIKARQTDRYLRNEILYAADGQIYFTMGEQRIPMLAMTREPQNLVLRHLNDTFDNSVDEVIYKTDFRPNLDEVIAALNDRDTFVFDLTTLDLDHSFSSNYSFLSIFTTDYYNLKPEQRRLAERVYGQGKDFVDAMNMLRDNGISTTRIYVLNPWEVQTKVGKKPLVQASWLYNHFWSDFFATGLNLQDSINLCGVPINLNSVNNSWNRS